MNVQNPSKKRRLKRQHRRQAGMTLIEIMVVVVILGLIGTVVGVALIRQFEESKVEITRTQVCKIMQALRMYRIKKSNFPSSGEGLQVLITSGNWQSKKIPKDPWNTNYVYRFPSTNNPDMPDVYSMGADKKTGGQEYNTKDIRCERD